MRLAEGADPQVKSLPQVRRGRFDVAAVAQEQADLLQSGSNVRMLLPQQPPPHRQRLPVQRPRPCPPP